MNEEFKNQNTYFLVTDEGITIENNLIAKTFFPYGSMSKISYALGLATITYEGKKYGFSPLGFSDTSRLKNAVQFAIRKNDSVPSGAKPVKLYNTTITDDYTFDGGAGDILSIHADCIVIKHKGIINALAMGIKGDKTVYYEDITAVQFKQAGITAGHIQFSIRGGNESRGGVLAAAGDENTITVANSKNAEAQSVVDYINKKLKELKQRKNAVAPIVQQASAADELKKFKELLDMGIITQEEFDAKKKQLLGL